MNYSKVLRSKQNNNKKRKVLAKDIGMEQGVR